MKMLTVYRLDSLCLVYRQTHISGSDIDINLDVDSNIDMTPLSGL